MKQRIDVAPAMMVSAGEVAQNFPLLQETSSPNSVGTTKFSVFLGIKDRVSEGDLKDIQRNLTVQIFKFRNMTCCGKRERRVLERQVKRWADS